MKRIVYVCFSFCSVLFIHAQTYNRLPIPQALKGPECTLHIIDTFAQLRSGNQTITGGINGHQFWGPTIFVNKGDTDCGKTWDYNPVFNHRLHISIDCTLSTSKSKKAK